MDAVRSLVREYVFMAQEIQLHPHEAGGQGAGDGGTVADELVDQGVAGAAGSRLLLSINFLASYNAKAIASQHIGMERPVAVTRRNQHRLQEICQRVDDCLLRGKDPPNRCDGNVAAALSRALEWFKSSSFAVSVIAPADSIPALPDRGQEDSPLGSILKQLREVQFVLLRSDDERTERSSQNILHLLRAIKSSGNPKCVVRQVENYAFQLRGLVKEWVYRVAPTVSASIYGIGLPSDTTARNKDKGNPAGLRVDISSNYLLPSIGRNEHAQTQMLHSGMSRFEIMHVVPTASVHPSMLMGCPLHGRSSHDVPGGAAKNCNKLKALAQFLQTERCGAMLRCTLQLRSEFYLMVPSWGESANLQFLFFRVASAEEVLIPPAAVQCQAEVPMTKVDEDLAMFEVLAQIPRRRFNPFHYRSDVIRACMKEWETAALSSKAPAHARVAKAETNPKHPCSRKELRSDRGSPSYTPIPIAKRKKLL